MGPDQRDSRSRPGTGTRAAQQFYPSGVRCDETLRAEVESLASHHEDADSLLENSPAASLFFFEPNTMAGRKVGAYRILRVIGSGGMAVVYLGERDDEAFRKLVAIKMVRPGPGGEEIYHRFRNERQTLAAIDHPNIVKLLDGGSTDDGLPYLVMEYVDGTQIDQYCDLHQLSIEQRLHLFRTVCSAVQYAHEKLIIHRDLKPANIWSPKKGSSGCWILVLPSCSIQGSCKLP
jgi:serine/threonine protein kinase